jgi:hypothetical protein
MKKIAFATFVTLFFATSSHATVYFISSIIDNRDIGLFYSISNELTIDLRYESGYGYANDFAIGGHVNDVDNDGQIDDGGHITLNGALTFNHIYAGYDARVTFNLAGRYVNGAHEGVIFNSGTILVETRGPTLEWVAAEITDAASRPLSFVAPSGGFTRGMTLDPVSPNQRNVFSFTPWHAAGSFDELMFADLEILGTRYHYGLTIGGDVVLETPLPTSD